MKHGLVAMVAVLLCLGCATKNVDTSGSGVATTLKVDRASDARTVLIAVPAESAMERFAVLNRDGRHIGYVAFTDTGYGGLVFVDGRLHGVLSKRDAQAFYSCRGFVSASYYYWARDASEWADSLIAAAVPADSVTLDFSGKSTVQSIKEVVGNPVLSDVKSLVDMGTNPFSILGTLSSAHSNMQARENYEKTLQALRELAPGASEETVAGIVRPEDLSFTSDGMVLAYPRFSLDFYVNAGVVKVIQQPSFQRLARLQSAIFYQPNLRWDRCTSLHWREALPQNWKPPIAERDGWSDAIGTKHGDVGKSTR